MRIEMVTMTARLVTTKSRTRFNMAVCDSHADAGMTAPCLQNRARLPPDQADPDGRAGWNFPGDPASNAPP
jgi:hypothetical protein